MPVVLGGAVVIRLAEDIVVLSPWCLFSLGL